jgi:hypothetical protein
MTLDNSFDADLLQVELNQIVGVDRCAIAEPEEEEKQDLGASERG